MPLFENFKLKHTCPGKYRSQVNARVKHNTSEQCCSILAVEIPHGLLSYVRSHVYQCTNTLNNITLHELWGLLVRHKSLLTLCRNNTMEASQHETADSFALCEKYAMFAKSKVLHFFLQTKHIMPLTAPAPPPPPPRPPTLPGYYGF